MMPKIGLNFQQCLPGVRFAAFICKNNIYDENKERVEGVKKS